ncbi:unnamed protein product [Malus baccata var. baccata]
MAPLLSCAAKHVVLALFLLFFLSPVGAQPSPDGSAPYQYQRFSPPLAIIIAVLIAALFLMVFFSVYVRRCSDTYQADTVRAGGSHTGRSRRGAASRGLDATVLDTFPTLDYAEIKGLKLGKEELECAVCLNEFEDDEMLRLIPKCDHVFHTDCIDVWLMSHTTCPVCRANLVPQPCDSAPQLTELGSEQEEGDVEAQNDAVDAERERDDLGMLAQQEPEVLNINQTLNRNRTRGSRSSRLRRLFSRSHSTGHSVVQPGEDTERFTLRLPVEVRKQIMNRKLNRSTSLLVLPREGSSRRGPRTGESSSINRVRSYRRLEPLDRQFTSDRWVFNKTPPFLTRMSSRSSPKVAAIDGETPAKPEMSSSSSARPPPKPETQHHLRKTIKVLEERAEETERDMEDEDGGQNTESDLNKNKKKTVIKIPSFQEVLESSQSKSTPPSLFTPSHSFSQAFAFVKSSEFYSPPPPSTAASQPPQTSDATNSRQTGQSDVPSSSSAPANAVASSSSVQRRNAILVSHRQKGNPLLKHIRNVRWEFADIVCDYLLGQSSCALYLSLRYHLLHPDYLYFRIRELQKNFKLRVVLCHVDVEDVIKPLLEVTKTALLHECTLLCGWSLEECGRYLETIKVYENKPADIIQGQMDTDYLSRVLVH